MKNKSCKCQAIDESEAWAPQQETLCGRISLQVKLGWVGRGKSWLPFFPKANWKDLWLKAKDGFWWFWRCKKWSTNWIQDQWGAEMHVFKPFGWCWTKVWDWFDLQHFFAVRTLNIIFRRWQRLVETIFEMPGTHGEIWKENEPILPA